MRIFITSTPDELEPQQEAAVEIVRELGHEPVLRNPAGRRGLDPVTACQRQVAFAAAVLAIVGWRRGRVPPATLGGDELRPWSYWEVHSAFEHGVPVVALMASEALMPEQLEDDPEANAVVADFRGELARLAAVFNDRADFRRLTRAKIDEIERASRPSDASPTDLTLRRFPPPELPAHPYPLLLPYTHPDLMAGRDGDLAKLRRTLGRPTTIIGLHAASGTGKSSFLAGSLVPALRAEGRPVAFLRHPTEPDLAARLLADLVENGNGDDGGVTDIHSFVDRLAGVHRLAGSVPPLLVIDQFEDFFKDGAEIARATMGTLLAASSQRLPGLDGPPCRWLLAYRQEYHGKLVAWLGDVLRGARALDLENTDALPHDLSDASRFAAWPLRPLATPPPGSGDPVEAAARVFQDAIEKPLCQKAFPWTFAPGHAERLARAFAEARIRRPDAPLVPELQVVLAHLLEQTGEPTGSEPVTVEVPEETGKLIDRALDEHLRLALDFAFPQGLDRAALVARSRALLVLRELADVHGRRQEGHAVDTLALALGEQGREVLEKLSTPRTRLVLRERHGDAGRPAPGMPGHWVYVLAHDQLAEVLVRVVDEGRWSGLGIDAELLGLRRFVVLESQLYAAGDAEQSTAVPSRYFRKIEANQEVLFWHDQHRKWWQACRTKRRLERRRQAVRRAVALVVVALVAFGVWTVTYRRARRQALLEDIAVGEPEAAFVALDELTRSEGYDAEELLDQLHEREKPFDVFERGLGGVSEERRAEVLLRVADLALPILETSPKDPVLIASLVWALDFFAARSPTFKDRALAIRNEVLGPLRRGRPAPANPDWADIPAGTFYMEVCSEDGHADPSKEDEHPGYPVKLSAFRMMTHEVTNAEYRQLFPDHAGDDDLPAARHTGDDDLPAAWMTWYEAYTYAAWLGGRLPTEPEWEYAARAGCVHTYCKRDGSKAALADVGWWVGNSIDPETGEFAAQRVMQLEPNPWGLWDVYGNVWEWNATWKAPYPEALETNPPGPTDSPITYRVVRGGSGSNRQKDIIASMRAGNTPDAGYTSIGFRVAMAE